MTQKKVKVNKIARAFHLALLDFGVKGLPKDFHLKPEKITYAEMSSLLKDITADQKLNYISLADSYYYVISWEEWREILRTLIPWLKKIPYIKDRMDCDNFAYLFSSLISLLFGLNSEGVVHGQVNIGHFWNAIVVKKDGRFKLFYYDVKRGSYMEHEKGQPIIMKGWHYTPDSYRFF